MPSDRKDKDRGSHKKTHSGGSSPKGHHKASDSGVGSLSDQDSLAANPDRPFAAHDLPPQSPSPYALQRLYSEIDLLNVKNKKLEADNHELFANLQKSDERCAYLESDNFTLTAEVRKLDTIVSSLQEANHALEERTQRYHSNPSRDHVEVSGSGGLGQEQPSAPKPRRRESVKEKHREDKGKDEQKERERLLNRFESKESTKAPSRSRRGSYVEPFGPGPSSSSSRPSVVVQTSVGSHHPPNSSRTYSTYPSSSSRPAHISIPAYSSSSIPRSPQTPAYSSYYPDSPHREGYETGDYIDQPLPRERAYRR